MFPERQTRLSWLLLALSVALYLWSQLGHLGHPLLWADEAETAMYAERVRDYGYPRVHGPRNVVYEFGTTVAQGVKEEIDAYIGTTWGHFYFALPGLLWAEGSDDPHTRTWRLRLPFALAGAAGLMWMLLAVLPVHRGRPGRALLFSALFFALAAASVSLQLHLRELRYYPLLVLLMGAIALVQLRHVVFRTLDPLGHGLLLVPLLVLLFNVFHPAWFATTALLGLERVTAAGRGGSAERRRALLGLVPLALSALCVAPLLVFYETFSIAGAFASELGLSLGGFAANLGRMALHFLRHEWLGPVLVTRVLVIAADGRHGATPRSPERRVADLLSLFAVGYGLVIALNPLVYERYTVVLSPVLALVLLLDAFHLVDRLPTRASPARQVRARVGTAAALAALTGLFVAARLPELRGRVAELTTPYRGPLDFAVAHLKQRYPRTEDLVIATNYESHALMYYLGSHVIVGSSLANRTRDLQLEPDVVIPRRRWRRGLAELGELLGRGSFERQRLGVRDLHWNNVPSLSPSPWVPDPHRFRTPLEDDEAQQLEIYERAPPDPGPHPSGTPPGRR